MDDNQGTDNDQGTANPHQGTAKQKLIKERFGKIREDVWKEMKILAIRDNCSLGSIITQAIMTYIKWLRLAELREAEEAKRAEKEAEYERAKLLLADIIEKDIAKRRKAAQNIRRNRERRKKTAKKKKKKSPYVFKRWQAKDGGVKLRKGFVTS